MPFLVLPSSSSLTDRKVSDSPPAVSKENRPCASGAGRIRKDSNGEIAADVALRMPYLSQLRYLSHPPKE